MVIPPQPRIEACAVRSPAAGALPRVCAGQRVLPVTGHWSHFQERLMPRRRKPTLDRREAVTEILKRRGDALVVAGLGAPCWDTAAAGDHPLNFYTWGGMGGAAMIGLGLALAQPKRRVLVITGDGEMLMGLGALATIGAQQPRNLAVIVMDNEQYGETG